MTSTLDIKFSSLEYKCERPNSNIRSKKLWPIIKFGRMVEQYNNPKLPAIRNYKEDLKRVTSYFYFDHMGRYIQVSKCLNFVLSYDIEPSKEKDLKHAIDIEQHCFEQLVERKISIKSIVKALKCGKEVEQYCLDKRKDVLYKNVSVFYKDLRVVASILNDKYRIKTAYRLTDINDKNLLGKLRKNQKTFTQKFSNPHDYAIVDMDKLYQSTLMINKNAASSKKELYSPAWELLGDTFGCYQNLLSTNNENVRSNMAFEKNQKIVDDSIVQSSLKRYRSKSFSQSDYNPKREYGLIFFYEKDSFMSLAKRVYGLGLSAKIVYKEKKVCPIDNKEIAMVGVSLTATSGHEWIKSSDRKELITIDTNTCNG